MDSEADALSGRSSSVSVVVSTRESTSSSGGRGAAATSTSTKLAVPEEDALASSACSGDFLRGAVGEDLAGWLCCGPEVLYSVAATSSTLPSSPSKISTMSGSSRWVRSDAGSPFRCGVMPRDLDFCAGPRAGADRRGFLLVRSASAFFVVFASSALISSKFSSLVGFSFFFPPPNAAGTTPAAVVVAGAVGGLLLLEEAEDPVSAACSCCCSNIGAVLAARGAEPAPRSRAIVRPADAREDAATPRRPPPRQLPPPVVNVMSGVLGWGSNTTGSCCFKFATGVESCELVYPDPPPNSDPFPVAPPALLLLGKQLVFRITGPGAPPALPRCSVVAALRVAEAPFFFSSSVYFRLRSS
mmetsp:Transcript_14789/g.36863  ORF Transcript_14789/g.36863 Transcript_14789/m.36863 type:complete len:357 (+) Transcript_14789:975-2045(+)